MAKKSRQKNPHKMKRKKNKKSDSDFFLREQKLNRLIDSFFGKYHNLSRPAVVNEYDEMNKLRLEIKRLLLLQEEMIWQQSYRRKRFYYEQLSRFKSIYTTWKFFTYYIYLHKRYDIPMHLIQAIEFYAEVSHSINYTIFLL